MAAPSQVHPVDRTRRLRLRTIAATVVCLASSLVGLAACSGEPDPTPEELAAVDYAPSGDVARSHLCPGRSWCRFGGSAPRSAPKAPHWVASPP